MKLDDIVENRIAEAIERGDLDRLDGKGRPIALDDDRDVPEELRLAYRILKNAGFVPPQVTLRNEIWQLERAITDGEHRPGAGYKKLALLKTKLAAVSRGESSVAAESDYHRRLLEKLD